MKMQRAPKFQWLPWHSKTADFAFGITIYYHYAGWLWWQFRWMGIH